MNDILRFFRSQYGLYSGIGIALMIISFLAIREFRHRSQRVETEPAILWSQMESLEDNLESDVSLIPVETKSRRSFAPQPFGYEVMQNRRRLKEERKEVHAEVDDFEEQPPLIKFRRPGVSLKQAESGSETEFLSIPSGIRILAYAIQPIFSGDEHDSFEARVAKTLKLDARVIVPVDTRIVGRIKRIGKGRVYFHDDFTLFFPDGSTRKLKADLRERAYDAKLDRYSMTNRRIGLPAREVDPEIDPVIGRVVREVGKTVKSVAIGHAEREVREQIPYGSVRRPLESLSEGGSAQNGEGADRIHYYVSTGTEFYLQAK